MTTPTIYTALAAVMATVRAVGKDGWNDHQKFAFRGIDGVVNAVGPALREHKVMVVPEVLSCVYADVVTTQNKASNACRVTVAYTFWGPAGDSIRTVVVGESWDAGDKATPKAMSVAFRTALLQALALPTDEPDPDEHTYERAPEPPIHTTLSDSPAANIVPLLDEIRTLAGQTGTAPVDVLTRFAAANDGTHLTRATAEQLRPVLAELKARKAKQDVDQADITATANSTRGQE